MEKKIEETAIMGQPLSVNVDVRQKSHLRMIQITQKALEEIFEGLMRELFLPSQSLFDSSSNFRCAVCA